MQNYINGNFIIWDKKEFRLVEGSMQVNVGRVISFNKNNLRFNETIDLKGKLVTPVFCNTHLHLGEYFFKFTRQNSIREYLSCTEKINLRIADNKEEIRKRSTEFTILENLKFGNLIVSTLRGNDVLYKYKLKAFCGFPIMQSEKLSFLLQSGINGYKNFCKDCRETGIIPGVFFHSFYFNNFSSFEFAKMCHKLTNTFFAIHVAEDEECEAKTFQNFKARSVGALYKHNLLNSKTMLVHGCTLNEEELNLIAEKKANISICPISNLNLSQSPINPMLLNKRNINWHISSDGMGTGETANLLKQATTLKELYVDVSFEDLFRAITINGCKFLKCEEYVLSVNSKANFLVFDIDKQQNLHEYLEILFDYSPQICYYMFEGDKFENDNFF